MRRISANCFNRWVFQWTGTCSMKLPLQRRSCSPKKLFWSWPAKERLTAGKRPCSGAPNAVPPSPRQSWIPGKPLRSFIHCPSPAGETVLPVATTRPELLFGCVCLFIHPENPQYGEFIGQTAAVPLYGFEIPILADEKADPEKGTGIVMRHPSATAPTPSGCWSTACPPAGCSKRTAEWEKTCPIFQACG